MFVSEKPMYVMDVIQGTAKASGNAYKMVKVSDEETRENMTLFVRDSSLYLPVKGDKVKIRMGFETRGNGVSFYYAGMQK